MFIIRLLRIPFVLLVVSHKLQRRRVIIFFGGTSTAVWISTEACLQTCYTLKLNYFVKTLIEKSYCWWLWELDGPSLALGVVSGLFSRFLREHCSWPCYGFLTWPSVHHFQPVPSVAFSSLEEITRLLLVSLELVFPVKKNPIPRMQIYISYRKPLKNVGRA